MKKSIYWLLTLFILLTTFNPKSSLIPKLSFKINQIKIENNTIINSNEIEKKLSFLKGTSLFLLKTKDISRSLESISFIESFTIKKVFPNKIIVSITEKTPIAVLTKEKKNFFISDKGELIRFKKLDNFENLPLIFGNPKSFNSLYKDLLYLKFPTKEIKSFYFFESERWDLVMQNGKVIKLPNKDYIISLEKFMNIKNDVNFKNYKIFDFRIKDQLILN